MRNLTAIALFALGLLTGCQDNAAQIAGREAAWNEMLATQIPVGSERTRIEAWAESKYLRLSEDPAHHSLHGVVEEIQGLGFACSTSYITIHIELDASGHSIRQNVAHAASCR